MGENIIFLCFEHKYKEELFCKKTLFSDHINNDFQLLFKIFMILRNDLM